MNAEPSVILGPGGKPAWKAIDTSCPECGAGKEKRVASNAFGARHPVCEGCGYEFRDEVWRGEHDSDRR